MTLRLHAAAALSVALLCGCRPAPQGSLDRAAAGSSPVAEPRARDEYSSAPTPGGVRGDAHGLELEARLRSLLPAAPAADGRLAELAEWTARETQVRGRPLGSATLSRVASRLGLIGPPPWVAVMPRDAAGWSELEGYVAALPRNIPVTHYGVAAFPWHGAVLGAVALCSVDVQVEPMPRHFPVGGTAVLRGRLAHGLTHPELAWTDPDGHTERTAIPTLPGFEVVRRRLARGVHRLEVLATGATGLRVIINLPVHVATPDADPSDGAKDLAFSTPRDGVMAYLNDERAGAGLPPLEEDAELDRIALAHSEDMLRGHFFGHESPTTGAPMDRMIAGGFRLTTVGENVARGADPREVHELLLESPAHRANILGAVFSHVGIGVVVDDAMQPSNIVVTQVFARFASAPGDPEDAATDLIEALSVSRAQRGLAPIAEHGAWTKAARELARRVARLSPSEYVAAAGKVRVPREPGHAAPLVLVAMVGDPMELATDAKLRDPAFRRAAAAIAPPATPDHRVAATKVVLIIGD